MGKPVVTCAECGGSGVDPAPAPGSSGDFCPSCLGSGRGELLDPAFPTGGSVEEAIEGMAGPDPGPVQRPVQRYLRRWLVGLFIALGISLVFRLLISMLQWPR